MKKEKLFRKVRVYKGTAADFYADRIKLQNGKTAVREYTRHPGAAAAIPFLPGNKIVMVKQYRYPVKKFMLEIPAGKISNGETPLSCIKRELAEETGFRAEKFIHLFCFHPTCAFSTEKIHIFAAGNLKKSALKPDADEFVEKVILDFNKAVMLVKNNKITDSKTIIALLLWDKIRYGKEFRKFLT